MPSRQRRAVATAEASQNFDPRLLADALMLQAFATDAQGRLADAEPLAERALGLRPKLLAADDRRLAQSHLLLAKAAAARRDVAKAEASYRVALGIAGSEKQRNLPDVAEIAAKFGAFYVEQARYADAEPLLRRVVEIQQQGSDPRAVALARLGQLYELQGRMTDSEPVLRRAFDISVEALGADNPAMFDMYAALAGGLQDNGKYAEAERLFEKAVALREQAAGADDLVLADTHVLLGSSYGLHGDYARAEPPYLRAMAIREKRLPAKDPLLADSLFNLAALYRREARYAEAEPLVRRGLSIREAAPGAGQPQRHRRREPAWARSGGRGTLRRSRAGVATRAAGAGRRAGAPRITRSPTPWSASSRCCGSRGAPRRRRHWRNAPSRSTSHRSAPSIASRCADFMR